MLDNQKWENAGIEVITFADGTSMSLAQLNVRYVQDQQTSDNDLIWGTFGSDIITGGAGNDQLHGHDQADTYHYNLGDGDDVIVDYNGAWTSDGGATDRIIFGAGITSADLIFSRVIEHGTDLRVTFKNSAESIIIDRQTWSNSGVELFVFADGSTLTPAQADALIVQATNGNNTLTGTAGNDAIWALEGNDTISGLAGDDRLFGQLGSDVLIGGIGIDELSGGGGADSFASLPVTPVWERQQTASSTSFKLRTELISR